MIRYQILSLILLVATAPVFAQDKPAFESYWIAGGTGSFGFSPQSLNISLSPQVGYRFSKHFAAGGGVNLQHWKNSFIIESKRWVAGLNAFGRVYPFRYMMLQAQPEANFTWGKDIQNFPPREEVRVSKLLPSLLLGGGAVLPVRRSEFIISLLYDVNQKNSIYGDDPFFRIMFFKGF